jgi:hypothetical protein
MCIESSGPTRCLQACLLQLRKYFTSIREVSCLAANGITVNGPFHLVTSSTKILRTRFSKTYWHTQIQYRTSSDAVFTGNYPVATLVLPIIWRWQAPRWRERVPVWCAYQVSWNSFTWLNRVQEGTDKTHRPILAVRVTLPGPTLALGYLSSGDKAPSGGRLVLSPRAKTVQWVSQRAN